MPNIAGSVPLGGFIAPTDASDAYAVHDARYGRDGLRSVATTSDRNAITADRRRVGMVVYTEDADSYWKLKPSPWANNDTDWIVWEGGASATTYTHIQSMSADVWTVVHNLGRKPYVQLLDSNDEQFSADVKHDSLNQLTVTLAIPTSGSVLCT